MLRALRRLLIVASIPAGAAAHHGVAAYDMGIVLTVEGVIDAWTWQNPHTSLTLRVGDGAQHFRIEGAPPRWMAGQGWSAESLAAGEAVTVTYHPTRRASGDYAAILMEVRRPNGTVLKVNRPASLGGP